MAQASKSNSAQIDISALYRAIEVPLIAALTEIGEREVVSIAADLSVPVEYTDDGVIRSSPGEPPRKEEGQLVSHVEYTISTGEELPELEISAHRPPTEEDDDPRAAIVLEEGGKSAWGMIAPRPFMAPALARVESYAVEVVASHFARNQ